MPILRNASSGFLIYHQNSITPITPPLLRVIKVATSNPAYSLFGMHNSYFLDKRSPYTLQQHKLQMLFLSPPLSIINKLSLPAEIHCIWLPNSKMDELIIYPVALRLGLITCTPEASFHLDKVHPMDTMYLCIILKQISECCNHVLAHTKKSCSIDNYNQAQNGVNFVYMHQLTPYTLHQKTINILIGHEMMSLNRFFKATRSIQEQYLKHLNPM